jgi:hypothetical protein
MTNVISFQEAKARREQVKLVEPPSEQDQPQKMTAMKTLSISSGKESLFFREARGFKFMRMETPHSFVVMNTKVLPTPFPPDNPPPMVA